MLLPFDPAITIDLSLLSEASPSKAMLPDLSLASLSFLLT